MAIASSNSSSNGENSRKSPVQEKPQHAHYLNEFRVEACPLFKQHQCQQHRPYTCFNWHFANQRRRKPLRKPDGSFNYSPDIYCDKYDENTGICPDGDECQYLHRVSGDVERKYHLRYYKTAQCVHPTDNRGQCVKNGAHCAFAHTSTDVRQPQFDQHDSMYPATVDGEGRDRSSFVIEDPLWHSQDHVLSCYKTEQCRKPARLCRQGYACPFYHNSKDRRRPPAIYKYRSTPCPAAKTVDEWLDPELCEAGDSCQYCHTRTEQQFHPEIYKSTKCNDMLEHGYCPRAVFCAFAHHDSELHLTRTPYVSQTSQPSPKEQCSPNGALTNGNSGSTDSGMRFGSPNSNGGSTPSYSAVLKNRHHTMPGKAYAATTDLISSSYPKAPGFERGPLSPNRNESVLGRLRTHSLNIGHLDMNRRNQILSGNFDFNAGTSLPLSSPLTRSDSGFHAIADNRGSVDSMDAGPPQEFMTRRTLEELSLDLAPIEENNGGRISDLFISANAVTSPMRIPGSDSFHTSPLTSFGENIFSSSSKTMLNSPAQNAFSSFENSLGGGFPIDEVEHSRNDQLAAWEEGLKQARQACEAWKADAEIYRMKAEQAELEKARALFERDQALQQLDSLKMQIAAVNIQAAFANAPQLSGNGSNGSMPSPGNSDYSDGLRAAISQYQMFSL